MIKFFVAVLRSFMCIISEFFELRALFAIFRSQISELHQYQFHIAVVQHVLCPHGQFLLAKSPRGFFIIIKIFDVVVEKMTSKFFQVLRHQKN